MTSWRPSQRCRSAEKYSAVTVPSDFSSRPPRESTSPLPSTVADGYQCPVFMSFTRVYSLVAGSKT